jgi:rare lipoprotein A
MLTVAVINSVRRYGFAVTAFAVASLYIGCAGTSRYGHAPGDNTSFCQTGVASYYGAELNGHKTASGERYDMHDLTAAHLTLPFNTRVRVTNLSNKKSVVVRINDRGPYTKRRVIDLSYAAAKQIGLVAIGTGKVKIEVIE